MKLKRKIQPTETTLIKEKVLQLGSKVILKRFPEYEGPGFTKEMEELLGTVATVVVIDPTYNYSEELKERYRTIQLDNGYLWMDIAVELID